jgi:hypothetical protein
MNRNIPIESCLAACNDYAARRDGCSSYERTLRELSPICLYQNDATFREIMIKLKVREHVSSLPWWARW